MPLKSGRPLRLPNSEKSVKRTFGLNCQELGVNSQKISELPAQFCVINIRRYRKRVFTTENMDSSSQDVYQQVFIKKRMPKGKKIK